MRFVLSQLRNKKNKAQQSPLCHVCGTVFGLKGAEITNGLESKISLQKMGKKQCYSCVIHLLM